MLTHCPKCNNKLIKGQDISDGPIPGSKGKSVYYLSDNLYKDTLTCFTCLFTYCTFCYDNAYDLELGDICMGCDRHYCMKCADKWHSDSKLNYMFGNHNICFDCHRFKSKSN